jgi:adenosine deaminase
MSLESYLRAMPKVELHVHLEGSIQPATLLDLAKRNDMPVPANSVEDLQDWYTFKDFPHFIEIYMEICSLLRNPDDIELITRQFLAGQAAQNIVHSEVTFTPYNHYLLNKIPFKDQLAAINRARQWAAKELQTTMTLTIDIPRQISAEEGLIVADWAISGMDNGVCAFGLGGPEVGNPPEKFKRAFERTRAAGLPGVPHAGETSGPDSIWGALKILQAVRIGHGVRCLEDHNLVTELRERQIPLEVCPTSNVCLKVVPAIAQHPLPKLLDEGLYVTINSDDPPMFNTNLTDEYIKVANTFHFDSAKMEKLSLNALRASFLPDAIKREREGFFIAEFLQLRSTHHP